MSIASSLRITLAIHFSRLIYQGLPESEGLPLFSILHSLHILLITQ